MHPHPPHLNILDVQIPFLGKGRNVPLDHGYTLYSGLCQQSSYLHELAGFSLDSLSGTPIGGRLYLPDRGYVRLRIPIEAIHAIVCLAAKLIDVAGTYIQLSAPQLSPIRPAACLQARSVVFHTVDPPRVNGRLDVSALRDRSVETAKKQLVDLGVQGDVEALSRRDICVSGHTQLAFGMRVSGLTDSDSILLQCAGLGGRNRMGCGFFRPHTR